IHCDATRSQPGGAGLTNARHAEVLRFEPHARCKPSGGPREFVTPYGIEIESLPNTRRVFVLDIGGPHTFREIYMDGRAHPKDLTPSYYGHSVGHWEGETLVIEHVGLTQKF